MIRFHERNRRIILIIALTVTLILSMTAVSFSWFSNSASRDGVSLTSGQIQAYVRAYRNEVSDDSLFYDAQISGNDRTVNVNSEGVTFSLNPAVSAENMFIILLNEGSDVMSLSANLGFSLDESASVPDCANLGGYKYQIDDITSFINIDGDVDIESISEALSAITSSVENNGEEKTLKNISDENIPVVLPEDGHDDFAVFMLTCTAPESASYHETYTIGFDASFMQYGGTIDSDGVYRYFIYSEDQLAEVCDKLAAGDSIYIMDDISFDGDLDITAPVSIFLGENELTVSGNIDFSYGGNDDIFRIDTTLGGNIICGGDFTISTQDTLFELFGNPESTDDISITGDFNVNASIDGGIIFDGCSVVDDGGNPKDVNVAGNTKIDIASAIKGDCPGAETPAEPVSPLFGDIVAGEAVQMIHIANHNVLNSIDLSAMAEGTSDGAPLIYIENYNDISGTITLPDWADTDNTAVVYRLGSDTSRIGTGVISGNSTFTDDDITIDTAPVPVSRNHQFAPGIVSTQPQCLSAGALSRKCSVCGYTENTNLSALGHSYDENGVCVRCGSVRSDKLIDNHILPRKAEPSGNGWEIDTTHEANSEGTPQTVTLASDLSSVESLSFDVCITGDGRENDSYITLTNQTVTNNAITFFPVNGSVENGPISTPELYNGEYTFDVEWGDFAIDNWHNVKYEFTTKNSKRVADIYIDNVKCGSCNYTPGSQLSIEVISEKTVILDNIKVNDSLVNDFENGISLDNGSICQYNICTVVYHGADGIGNAYALVGSDFTISSLPSGISGWSLTEGATAADYAPGAVVRMPDEPAVINLYKVS